MGCGALGSTAGGKYIYFYVGFIILYTNNVQGAAKRKWGYNFFDVGRNTILVHICMFFTTMWEFVIGTNTGMHEGCAKSGARNNAHVAPIYMVGAPSRQYHYQWHSTCATKVLTNYL